MNDFYYIETSVCKNKGPEKVKYYVLFALSALSWALVLFSVFALFYFPIDKDNVLVSILVYVVLIVFFVFSALFLGRIKNRFCLDYDYEIVSGSIRLYAVSNNRSNRKIAEFNARDIIKIGKTSDAVFDGIINAPESEEIIATSNLRKDEAAFYILAAYGGNKKVFIMDCSEVFIRSLFKFMTPSVVKEVRL